MFIFGRLKQLDTFGLCISPLQSKIVKFLTEMTSINGQLLPPKRMGRLNSSADLDFEQFDVPNYPDILRQLDVFYGQGISCSLIIPYKTHDRFINLCFFLQ